MQTGSPLDSIPVGCPMHNASMGHRPFEHEGMYRFFAEVRPEAPVFYSPEIDYWVLTRREDVLSVIRDYDRFSAVIATQPVCPWPDDMMAFLKEQNFTNEAVQVACDRPRHTRIRDLAGGFLNMRRFQIYEPAIRKLVQGHISRMQVKETVDLVDALTYELPAQVVFLLLGEESFDPRKIKSWGDLRINLIWGRPSHEEQMDAARDLLDFWHYATDLVEQRKKYPRDDYPSFLLATRNGDDSVLTENEIKSLVFGLLLAGHETTTNAAGNILLELLRRPQAWKALVDDPTYIPNAVEEGLRYASSVVAWRRLAKEDVEIGGVQIGKGSKLLLSLGSANRDVSQFEDGETFDIARGNARSHIAFGNGIHHCIGAPLARLELRIVLEELTAAYPNMKLVEGEEIHFTATISFRGPDRLLVRPEG